MAITTPQLCAPHGSVVLLLVVAVAGMFVGTAGFSQSQPQQEAPPTRAHGIGDLVPDKATAIKIADAVLVKMYGERTIRRERPLVATLEGDVWTVQGTFRPPVSSGTPKKDVAALDAKGGVALIEISKIKGCILRVTHGK